MKIIVLSLKKSIRHWEKAPYFAFGMRPNNGPLSTLEKPWLPFKLETIHDISDICMYMLPQYRRW